MSTLPMGRAAVVVIWPPLSKSQSSLPRPNIFFCNPPLVVSRESETKRTVPATIFLALFPFMVCGSSSAFYFLPSLFPVTIVLASLNTVLLSPVLATFFCLFNFCLPFLHLSSLHFFLALFLSYFTVILLVHPSFCCSFIFFTPSLHVPLFSPEIYGIFE